MRKFSFRNVLLALFGVFMVAIYLGMALLFALNFFDWDVTPMWTAARWAMSVILGLYGFYRAYRLVVTLRTAFGDGDDEPFEYGAYPPQVVTKDSNDASNK